MRTTTPEGHRLRITPAVVARIAPHLRRLGLDPLVRANYRGSLPGAIQRSLSALARRSRYAGAMIYPNASQGFAAFTAPLGGTPYRLLARPTADRELELAAAYSPRADDIPEFAAKPVSGSGTVNWDSPLSLDQAIDNNRGQSGLYIVESDLGDGKGWRPLYIGQGDIVGELRRELRATNHVRAAVPAAQFQVRVGHLDRRATLTPQQVETTMLRQVFNDGQYTLANDNYQYRNPMLIPARRTVQVTHRGGPTYLGQPGKTPGTCVHRVTGGATGGQFEMSPPAPSVAF
jgi:hypothetical protein